MSYLLLASGFFFGLSAGLGVVALTLAPPQFLARHAQGCGRDLAFLRSPVSGRKFVMIQGIVAGGCLVVLGAQPLVGLVALIPVLAAKNVLRVLCARRIAKLDMQVEGWVADLARAMEGSPSLGEALVTTAGCSDAPLRDELEQTLGEVHLGRSIDRALAALGERVNSRNLGLALSTLAVGRETGGNLPVVLRTAADSLREMERLEGVLRTKTAEGKMQALVISVLPAFLYVGVGFSKPEYFEPLETTAMGQLLLGGAGVCWLLSGFLTFKILSVEI